MGSVTLKMLFRLIFLNIHNYSRDEIYAREDRTLDANKPLRDRGEADCPTPAVSSCDYEKHYACKMMTFYLLSLSLAKAL